MSSKFGLNSWRNQPIHLTIIRLWLGVTWVYGGWNKAADNGYLNRASSHYIGAQLTGMVHSSPLGFLLKHFISHAQLMGWFVMLGEFTIGLAVLLGVALQLTALAGASMSLVLWLSVTWSVWPYFLGSDTAYLVLWIALFFMVRAQEQARGRYGEKLIPQLRDRREVLRLGGTGLLAGLFAALGSKMQKSVAAPSAVIAKLADLPVGAVKQFTAKDGNPAYLFRTKVGVFAYSAICTHQGCTVSYDQLGNVLACPCHGAKYDPNNGAAVVAGPAPAPLAKLQVAISGDHVVQL
jgi:thiosulfate dehydrogenase [quinone] large subunit